jgi:hypothetical protein
MKVTSFVWFNTTTWIFHVGFLVPKIVALFAKIEFPAFDNAWTCKFTNACKKMECMLVAMNCKIIVEHKEEKKLQEIQMCLSLKGTINHLGQKQPCISL